MIGVPSAERSSTCEASLRSAARKSAPPTGVSERSLPCSGSICSSRPVHRTRVTPASSSRYANCANRFGRTTYSPSHSAGSTDGSAAGASGVGVTPSAAASIPSTRSKLPPSGSVLYATKNARCSAGYRQSAARNVPVLPVWQRPLNPNRSRRASPSPYPTARPARAASVVLGTPIARSNALSTSTRPSTRPSLIRNRARRAISSAVVVNCVAGRT